MNKLTKDGLVSFYDEVFVRNLERETELLSKRNLSYKDLPDDMRKMVDEIIDNIKEIVIEISGLIAADYYGGRVFAFKYFFKRFTASDEYKERLEGHYESLDEYRDIFRKIGKIIENHDDKTLEIISLSNLTSVLGYASFIQNQICDDYALDNVGNYKDGDAVFNKDIFESFVLHSNILKRKNQER